MKLFKISFISFISILIFQSQLYGINLRCDFKQRLNDTEFNGVKCNDDKSSPICYTVSDERSGELKEWISSVSIRNKKVFLINEPTDYFLSISSDKVIEMKRDHNMYSLEVESMVHHNTDTGRGNKKDSYIFVFENQYNLYSLYFENFTKKTTLIHYKFRHKEPEGNKDHQSSSELHFGECEIE